MAKFESDYKTTEDIKVPEALVDQVIGQERAVEIIKKVHKGYVKYPNWRLVESSLNLYQQRIKDLENQKESLRSALIDIELRQFKGISNNWC